MKNVIEELAASNAVSWGTIAKKIDENFDELENSIQKNESDKKSFSDLECREAFVSYMNKKAKEIGMKNTIFLDPTGRTNISTAYDMCKCLVHASGYARLQDIWSKSQHEMTFIKEDGSLRKETITHGLIGTSFKGVYNPMGGKGGSLSAGIEMGDGVTLSKYVSNMSCILQSAKNEDNYYAITTMSYYDDKNTAYGEKIQAIKDVMKIIDDYGDVIVDDSSLDEVAYGGKTYRDIFIGNNLAPNINAGNFDNSVNGEYPYKINTSGASMPSIEENEVVESNYVPPYSLYINSENSLNVTNSINYDRVGNTYFAAANVKITEYTAGRLGVTLGSDINVVVERVTDGYEVVSGIGTPKASSGTKVAFYVGSSGGANLTGFINNPVIVNLNIFSSVPSLETMTALYKEFTSRLQTIYSQNLAMKGSPVPNADYICAFKLPKYNALSYQDIELNSVYSKNPSTKFYPASMSKMMTAMITLDFVSDLNEKVTMMQEDVDAFPTSNWYKNDILVGETLTIKDVLYIMMMSSSNSATEIISRVIGEKILISRTI